MTDHDFFMLCTAASLEINDGNGEILSFDADNGHFILRARINPALGCNAE
jgi:hypothetical protein